MDNSFLLVFFFYSVHFWLRSTKFDPINGTGIYKMQIIENFPFDIRHIVGKFMHAFGSDKRFA